MEQATIERRGISAADGACREFLGREGLFECVWLFYLRCDTIDDFNEMCVWRRVAGIWDGHVCERLDIPSSEHCSK